MGEGDEGKLFNFLHPVGSRKSDIPPTKENTARGQHRKLLYIFILYSRHEEGWGGAEGGVTPIGYIIFNIFIVIRTTPVISQSTRGGSEACS